MAVPLTACPATAGLLETLPKANEKAKVVRFVPGLTAESATHRP